MVASKWTLPSNVIVTFTPDEITRIHAESAQLATVTTVNWTRRDLRRTQAETNHVALIGEFAVAKLFGIPFDECGILLINKRQLDDGIDLTLPDGTTAQIKAIHVHSNPDRGFWFPLEGPNSDEFTADVGIMVYVLDLASGRSKIPGYVTRERFVAEHVLASQGTGKRAAMATSQFNPIEQLLARMDPAE